MKNTSNINGFTRIENERVEQLIEDVGLSTAMVYHMIKRHNLNTKNNHSCYPSNKTLAKECSTSVRNLQKHLTKLVEAGWLIIDSGNESENSTYYFPKSKFYQDEANHVRRRKGKNGRIKKDEE